MTLPTLRSEFESRLAALAVEKGILSVEHVDGALAARNLADPASPLERTLVSMGYLTGLQAEDLARAAAQPEKPAPAEPLIQIVGHCTLLEPIGRGASGSVYKAFHPELRREVALKLVTRNALNAPHLERFAERAERALAVEHESFARVHEVGRHKGALYIASELVKGIPLYNLVCLRGPLDLGSAITVLKQVGAALGAVHDAGAVHGNLKAENVFLTGGSAVKVTDPGLARDGVDFLRDLAYVSGDIIFYLPPEQWIGEARPASDIYACGVLWHFMLSGRFAFGHRWTREIRKNHEEAVSEPPSAYRDDLPPGADVLYRTMVQKDPELRYARAADMVADLDRLERGLPPAGAGRRTTRIRRLGRPGM